MGPKHDSRLEDTGELSGKQPFRHICRRCVAYCVGVWLFVWPSKQLVAFLILFAILEVLGHLNFGWVALRRYSVVGKTTVYFPGNFTGLKKHYKRKKRSKVATLRGSLVRERA